MLVELLPLLFVGFGLGFTHAFDADHVMAVSVLSNEKPSFKRTLLYSANWALGHGLTLVVAGALMFGLGLVIPEALQSFAEASVGALLIVLGLWCFVQFRKEKVKFEVHSHGDVVHAHFHDGSAEHESKHLHRPVFVGVLHGLAGSAPVLALIPAVSKGELLPALLYLGLFSLGVMLAMMAFGFGFGQLQQFLAKQYNRVFLVSRQLLAAISIGLGSFWLYNAI